MGHSAPSFGASIACSWRSRCYGLKPCQVLTVISATVLSASALADDEPDLRTLDVPHVVRICESPELFQLLNLNESQTEALKDALANWKVEYFAALPEIESPLQGQGSRRPIASGREGNGLENAISDLLYLQLLKEGARVRVLQGHFLESAGANEDLATIVLSESLAKALFVDSEPTGQSVELDGQKRTVIGVVTDGHRGDAR